MKLKTLIISFFTTKTCSKNYLKNIKIINKNNKVLILKKSSLILTLCSILCYLQGASKSTGKSLNFKAFLLFKINRFVPPLLYKLENTPLLSFTRSAFFLEALDVLEVVVGADLQLDTSSFITDDDPLRMEL